MFRIENKIEQQMLTGIKNIARKLSSIPTITSPEIGTLYNVMHLYDEIDAENIVFQILGFKIVMYASMQKLPLNILSVTHLTQ